MRLSFPRDFFGKKRVRFLTVLCACLCEKMREEKIGALLSKQEFAKVDRRALRKRMWRKKNNALLSRQKFASIIRREKIVAWKRFAEMCRRNLHLFGEINSL